MDRTLDLVLKSKWFDMIFNGIKKEEYREIKPYWVKRFTTFSYSQVRFRRGYSNISMCFKIKSIKRGFGKQEWGAPDKEVYIIKFDNE